MSYDLIVRGGRLVTPDGIRNGDIGISEGRIVAIEEEVSDAGGSAYGGATPEIDARGRTVFPGMVDAHVHFNDPGRDAWEGGATGSAALAAGGGTTFVDMPLNASPPTLDGSSFDAKVDALSGRCFTDFALYGGLTPANLDTMEELAERGVVGYKAFMVPSGIEDFQYADDLTLLRGMEIASRLGLPVLLHAESISLVSALADELLATPGADDAADIRAFLDSRPIISELQAISRALLFAEETGCKVHIVHVTNPRGIALVRDAVSRRGIDASCETCPHYLFLNEDDAIAIGARAKCAPPLRSEAVRKALLESVLAGAVDTIGSDHSPAPESMKSGPYRRAWGGISGAQSLLRILLTLGIPEERVAALAAQNPAERFALPGKGKIAVGYDADLTIVDVEKTSALLREELRDRHRLSPYVGRDLKGHIDMVLLRGRPAGESPRGQLLRPSV